MTFLRLFIVFAILAAISPARFALSQTIPIASPPVPMLRREMRGVWIATVDNIDWPSRPGLPVAAQKAEMIDLLTRAKNLGLNAVFFQLRPSTDAFYESKLEPWSEFLSGEMGRAPQPFYDPLAFAIAEAHARGLELHAWFNPYRARYAGAKTPPSPRHIARARPDLVRQYGKLLWLDPGETEVQNHTASVILDVVRRYDIDGVHFDDYFYPYPERDDKNQPIPFPDDPSWNRYKQNGGTLPRAEWRRENVNTLVERLSREIKIVKPYVRFGISPFGIWRPGFPGQIQGFDAYQDLYADSKKWLVEGWVDYLVPQLYWKIDAPGQSFPVLLNWWSQQNPKNRHLWAGQYTSRAVENTPTRWPEEEIEYQIRIARGVAGASGTVHFSAKSVLRADVEGLTKRLAQGVYREPALVPASPWLRIPGPKTSQTFTLIPAADTPKPAPGESLRLNFAQTAVWQWAVQTRSGNSWTSLILPGTQASFALPARNGAAPIEEIAVSAIDRVGNQSAVQRVRFGTLN